MTKKKKGSCPIIKRIAAYLDSGAIKIDSLNVNSSEDFRRIIDNAKICPYVVIDLFYSTSGGDTTLPSIKIDKELGQNNFYNIGLIV